MNAAAQLALEKKRLLAEAQAELDAENEKIRAEEERLQKIKDDEENAKKAIDEAKKKERRDEI